MKIIGKTADGFIVDVSRDEMANLVGFYSQYDDEFKEIGVGDEVDAGLMYERLWEQSKELGELRGFAKRLREIADLLEPFPEFLKRSSTELGKESKGIKRARL